MAESSLKERTARGLFWGGLSGGVQQLLALVIGICLARRLAPGDYGIVAMLTVFSLIAWSLQESGFISAIGIKKNVSHADYNAVFWFSTGMGVLLYVVLFFAAPAIAAFNRTPELTVLARVTFIGFVISSFSIVQSAYLFRNLMVKQRMIASFVAVCAGGVVGISLVYSGYAYWGLVAQDLTFKTVVTISFWVMSPWRPRLRFDMKPVREMFSFSSKILATNILTTLNNQFLQGQMGHYFPRREVGLYSQANKWNTMGYSLITTTLSSVAQPVLAGADDGNGRQLRVFRKMLRFTAFLSFPAMFGLALIAPEFVPLALREQWTDCVPYLQVLCVAGATIPVSQQFSNLLVSRGRSSKFFIGTAGMMAAQLAIILGLYLTGHGVHTLICSIAALQIAWMGVWFGMTRSEIRISTTDTLRDILPFAAAAGISVGAAWAASLAVDGMVAKLAVKSAVAVAVYCAVMKAAHAVVFKECTDFLLSKIRRGK